jgi:transposase-like protein
MHQIHPNARTTLAVRVEIARSAEPSGLLAQRYGVSAETIRRWRKRGAADCLDRSARPHTLPWSVKLSSSPPSCRGRSSEKNPWSRSWSTNAAGN